jgi:hypothetical protein
MMRHASDGDRQLGFGLVAGVRHGASTAVTKNLPPRSQMQESRLPTNGYCGQENLGNNTHMIRLLARMFFVF